MPSAPVESTKFLLPSTRLMKPACTSVLVNRDTVALANPVRRTNSTFVKGVRSDRKARRTASPRATVITPGEATLLLFL